MRGEDKVSDGRFSYVRPSEAQRRFQLFGISGRSAAAAAAPAAAIS
jgi:hypothetical protein